MPSLRPAALASAFELPSNRRQARLLVLAAVFILAFAAILSLSPAGRARSWQVSYRWDHWLGVAIWLGMLLLAHRASLRWLPECDPYLLPAAALLSGWGLLTIWRLSPYFGMRQSLWLLVVLALFILGMRLPSDMAFLRRYKYLALTSGLLLTALTLIFGSNPAGGDLPRLWLGCCGIYLQPSEPLKLLLIVYLAAYLAGSSAWALTSPGLSRLPQAAPTTLLQLAPTLLMTGLALLLLVAQRDLGTATLFLSLYAAVVYVASGRARFLALSALGILAAGATGYALFDVVRLRIDAWINPWLDPSGRSYQIVQSLLAIAGGGLLGRGPGMGNPSLVPIPHSDFIFAAIAEEGGLLNALGLIALLALLTARGLTVALNAHDRFRRYLAAGLTAHLAGQSILIIGGNLRLLPLTGVTLPFVSYGGSSLLTSWMSLLLLLHISRRSEAPPAPLPDSRPYLNLSVALLAGLAACAIVAGWWAVYRGPDLLTRTDNARRAIAERYVLRGAILDRRNAPLAISTGKPGEYQRQVLHPPLSPVIGYNNPLYGQSGLEASLDDYLRGTRGYPGLTLWWNHLLYGQPPPGLNVRTTLDLDLQRLADSALAGHRGALLLLNAQNGEILVMASHPTFDANQLEADWESLIQDPATPLFNRAALGIYPAGELLTDFFPEGQVPAGLELQPYIPLLSPELPSAGNQDKHLSPLQAALLAAAISQQGLRPAPLLVSAVNTPSAGWVVLPQGEKPLQWLEAAQATALAASLAQAEGSIWQATSVDEGSAGELITWYLGGALPDWGGASYAVAVLLEEKDPNLAAEIGASLLKAAMQP
ncbi:MAG: FtsW/RodA/SpoVE family cell cycle protein [Anaerolineales bacterium]|nr:FtsW/RodA/SpoVE family cell cycle protein [Anaerolineales bacterium]